MVWTGPGDTVEIRVQLGDKWWINLWITVETISGRGPAGS